MDYITNLIQNPPSDVLDFIDERAIEQLDKFRHYPVIQQLLTGVFGEDAIKDTDLESFATAYGLLGLANKAGSFQNPPQVNQDALEFLPHGLDIDSYSNTWLIASGVHFALDVHDEDTDRLETVLKLIHQHNAIGNWTLDIDQLHSATADSRIAVEEITSDLANKTALELFGEIAQESIEEHIDFIKSNGFDDDTGDFCLTDSDIDRINQCDLAILAIMQHNLFAYDVNIKVNYGDEDVLASFMGVYDLFVKYQDKDVVEAVRQAIAGVKPQPTEEKENVMDQTKRQFRPILFDENTLSTATLSNKGLADKILSYTKENVLADFVKLIDANADIYGEPNLSELGAVEVDTSHNKPKVHLVGENYSFVVEYARADYHHENDYPSKALLFIGTNFSELDLQNIDRYKNLGMDVTWSDGSYLFSDFKKQLDSLVSFFKLSQ